MNLFDDVFIKLNELIVDKGKSLDYINAKDVEEGKNSIIFNDDLAYELGSMKYNGTAGFAVTDNIELLSKDEVLLIGNDLENIKEDTSFARISFVRVDDSLTDGKNLFKNIRKIDYVRYHVTPLGYMVRISPTLTKESVKVSKKALKNKLSFASIGKEYIKKYKEMDYVKNVKIVFITDPIFDYAALNQYFIEQENITKALDHLTNKVNMDCHTCNLQVICEQVEILTKNMK